MDKNLEEGTGYLLLGIETSRDLKSIYLTGPRSLELSARDIRSGSDFILTDVPAGTYKLDKIRLNHRWSFNPDEEKVTWTFKVNPGQISYVGNLEVIQRGFWITSTSAELVNRSSQALEFLEDNFSNILKNRELVFTGPGEDDFFQYVNSLKAE